jgi:methylthioribose-1-phosphate isomerase
MTTDVAGLVAVRLDGDALRAIDQTVLPWREEELVLRTAGEVATAIRKLQIRGAPLIGVAAAYGVALAVVRDPSRPALDAACETLRSARPTAVNLAYAVDRVHDAVLAAPPDRAPEAALATAHAIRAEEEAASAAMAAAGADLLAGTQRVMTHCNTGALAAPGNGTALGVIVELWQRGDLRSVIANETRPLLQGARLTVYELARFGIPHALAVDSAAPGLIAAGEVDAVIVGCDRVAANGDVANKVGTYGLALAAQAAGIPFVVAGPTTTIDARCPSGAEIEIEERSADEVRSAAGANVTMPDVPCRNPAFDVTPAALVAALVTERGVARPVGPDTVSRLLG